MHAALLALVQDTLLRCALTLILTLTLTLTLTLPPAHAATGAWEARTPQNQVVRITQDSFRARDAYLLQRLYPDGSLDAGFGSAGSTAFTLGPDNEGPAALRLDAAGRAWVAGASLAAGGRVQAVVVRFLPDGRPDLSYAQSGRSATAPAALAARALDVLPLPDGSAWVVGLVTDEKNQERAGWWRLQADGSLDPAFASRGLWLDNGKGSTSVQDLQALADGSVTLVLQREQGGAPHTETWLLAPGARQPVLLPGTAAAAVQTGAQAAASVPRAGASSPVPLPVFAAVGDVQVQPAAAASAPGFAAAGSASQGPPKGGWWLAVGAGMAGVLAWLLVRAGARRRSARQNRH